MRVVFMGTPAFAVPSLRALADRHDVLAAYTRPDKPAGRGRVPTPSPVASAAEELGVPVIRAETLRGDAPAGALAALRPEVVCVVAYGLILPRAVLDVPELGCVNVHASLLPRWRGAAPIERAVLAGDSRTGVSVMRLEEGLDSGPVALRVEVGVDDLTADALRARLAVDGATALLVVLERMSDGSVDWTSQDESQATYAAKLSPSDVALDPILDAVQLARRVRASSRSAPCRATIDGKPVTVLDARATPDGVEPGGVALVDGVPVLGTAAGSLRLERLVPAGRAAMSGAEYARGARIGAGAAWSAPL